MKTRTILIVTTGIGLVVALITWIVFVPIGKSIIPQQPIFQELPSPTPTQIPSSHVVSQKLHVYQTFNNCGPASLSMQLSYFDINISQQEIGRKLRPFQNPAGDNDDKSVTLDELAEEAKIYGLVPFHRPNGSLSTLKTFIANSLPVVVRTLTKPDESIGHYRLVRGYDDTTGEIVQDDSLQDKNLRFSYQYLLSIWKPFNYEYLVLVPPEKEALAVRILGEDVDVTTAWKKSREHLESELRSNPDDIYTLFNLSIASYYLGDYKSSISYFEQVEPRLPFRTLWYQIEPIEAYLKVKNYKRLFEFTDTILNNYNRAFSELYLLRGRAFLEQGKREEAKQEFEKAVFYNRNSYGAKEALESF